MTFAELKEWSGEADRLATERQYSPLPKKQKDRIAKMRAHARTNRRLGFGALVTALVTVVATWRSLLRTSIHH